ncbi:hypothetical protein HL667_33580 [Bradyrhizobium sp. 83012]|uniref:Uncharacterized protein n=1 Tax=Bradyrhizobium aeschynomenes TaxID=2734909 RepID=A0ABX2CP20_9BRAD|nr:hypothetical protein [Bradyrhizobium aeschynomenes]NPU69963.1 hypothetical protein [Bradyrhizobium aeschynomenes]
MITPPAIGKATETIVAGQLIKHRDGKISLYRDSDGPLTFSDGIAATSVVEGEYAYRNSRGEWRPVPHDE